MSKKKLDFGLDRSKKLGKLDMSKKKLDMSNLF